jgi:HEAT repeat protein
MPRPRKYANPAERTKAYRIRKKIRESGGSPGLDEVAKSLHKQYQDWAKFGLIDSEKQIGKTPQETLLRAIAYDLLWEKYLPVDADCERPPLEELLQTYRGAGRHQAGYIISSGALAGAIAKYAGVCLDEEDEEDEEQKKNSSVG